MVRENHEGDPWQMYDTASIEQEYARQGTAARFDPGSAHWVVRSYQAAQQVLDTRNEDIDNSTTLLPLTPRSELAQNVGAWRSLARLGLHTRPVTADAHDPVHAAVRRALFSPGHPASINYVQTPHNYEPLVSDVVAQAVHDTAAGLREGQVDLAVSFARPIAGTVIRRAVGFDDKSASDVQRWSDAQTSLLGRKLAPAEQVVGLAGLADLAAACRGLIRSRRQTGDASGIAGMLAGTDLTNRQAGSALMNVIAAGYSTTFGTILNATRRLLSDRDREYWQELPNLDKPTTTLLMGELTRLETGLIGWKRRPRTDIELDGAVIPRHAPTIVHLGAANRDPLQFVRPHEIRLDRWQRGEPASLSFGHGPHLCVGRALAQLELHQALTQLRDAAPNLRQVGQFTPYDPDYLFRTPQELIVI